MGGGGHEITLRRGLDQRHTTPFRLVGLIGRQQELEQLTAFVTYSHLLGVAGSGRHWPDRSAGETPFFPRRITHLQGRCDHIVGLGAADAVSIVDISDRDVPLVERNGRFIEPRLSCPPSLA